ncbi:MAG: hypothetical protein INQ03_21710 [Candidatus Heimdallarchaeota archaeon]|nr:hypothetical protein [Candidatus Heimdallarchaeota archaeon]
MDLGWLDHCRLLFKSPNEAYMLLGSRDDPRSHFIKIKDQIYLPERFPPTPEIHLQRLFDDSITLTSCDIKHEYKLIISILLRFDYPQNIDPPKEIQQWITNGAVCDEIVYFIEIIRNMKRKARQYALHDLVACRSSTSEYLGYLLLFARAELACSVLREFARWGIHSELLLLFAQNQHTGVVQWYTQQYIHANQSHPPSSPLVNASILLVNTLHKKTRLRRSFKDPQALIGLIHLDTVDRQLFSESINTISFSSDPSLLYRRAIIRVLKYAEMNQSSTLFAGLLCLLLIERGLVFEDGKQSIIPSKKMIDYPLKRIMSQFTIWEKSNRKELVTEALIFFLTHLPGESLVADYLRFDHLDVNAWVSSHPVFRRYAGEIQLIIYNDQNLLSSILKHLSRHINTGFFSWIIQNIEEELLIKAIATLDFNEKLYLYAANYTFPPGFNLLYHLKKGRKGATMPRCDFQPAVNQFKKTLAYFYRMRFPLPTYLLIKLIKYMHQSSFQEENVHKLFIRYLDKVILSQEEADSLANLLINTILDYNHQNCSYCVHIQSYVDNWKKYTSFQRPEILEDTILGIKLANLDIYEQIELDSIRPITAKTIAISYKLLNGSIHEIIEGNIAFAIKKYNWDQLARHYIALGMQRPTRDALIKSELKDVPKMITRDQLGRIALVSQTLNYCMQYGFTKGFEQLIISNIYLRGWNIDTKIENKLPIVLGTVGYPLRSYFAAYLILDKGDLSPEVLLLAREVNDKVIRDRLLRTLERIGSVDLWYMLAGSTFEDLSSPAIDYLKRARMGKLEKMDLIQRLLNAERRSMRRLGMEWIQAIEFAVEENRYPFTSFYNDTWLVIMEYYLANKRYLNEHYPNYYTYFASMLLQPNIPKEVNQRLLSIILSDDRMSNQIQMLMDSSVQARKDAVIQMSAGGIDPW